MYSLKIAVNFLPIHAQAFHLMHYSLVMRRQLGEEVGVDEEGTQLRQLLFKILCYLIEGALSLLLSVLASYGALTQTVFMCKARLTS